MLWVPGWARRAPGIRQRASELREQSCPAIPPALLTSGPEQQIQQTAQERSFGVVLGSLQTRSHFPKPFSLSSPGCILPFLLASNTIFYSLLHWWPDWSWHHLIFKIFSYFSALLVWLDTKSIFFCTVLFPVSVSCCFGRHLPLFLVYFGAQALGS